MNRLKYPVPAHEMERRHGAVRQKMQESGVDCLVMYNTDKWFPGALRYLTDLYVLSYPVAALFGVDAHTCFYGSGEEGGKGVPDFAAGNIQENQGLAFLPVHSWSNSYIPAAMAETIKARGYRRVGFCYLAQVPASIYAHLKEELRGVEFVDFSDEIDHILAVKSPWELEQYKRAVRIHDHLMAAVPAFLRPGRTERQVSADIKSLAQEMDCEEFNVLAGASPGAPAMNQYLYQNREIQRGDHFHILIEVATPGGFWAECARTFCLGEPSPEMRRASEDAAWMQDHFAKLCVPGARPAELFAKNNELLAQKGYRPEKRYFIHGQGYDIVQRPNFCPQETMVLQENMFIAIHPNLSTEKSFMNYTDNFVVTPQGAVRLSSTPRELFVV